MIYKNFIITAISGVLAGCVPAYQLPAGMESAVLVLNTNDRGVRNLWFYHYPGGFDGYNCSASPAQAIAILNNQSLVTKYPSDRGRNGEFVFTNIQAGKPFRLGALYPTYQLAGNGIDMTLCQPHVRFIPRVGVTYHIVHAEEGDVCNLAISAADTAGNEVEVDFERLPICFDSKNMSGIWFDDIQRFYEANPDLYK